MKNLRDFSGMVSRTDQQGQGKFRASKVDQTAEHAEIAPPAKAAGVLRVPATGGSWQA
ncbi:MAG: hypothetical protein QOI16_4280 [Pseudonocardiales bacterium]|jgi:hypothetical protein|nr:hypothetical protein [Pseudonocardiales bacterium]